MIRPSIYFPKTCCLKKQNLFQDISTLLRYVYYILYCKLKFLGVSPPIHWSIVSYSKTAGFIILCMHGKYVWMHPSELVTFAALMYISSIYVHCTVHGGHKSHPNFIHCRVYTIVPYSTIIYSTYIHYTATDTEVGTRQLGTFLTQVRCNQQEN